ncbi:MAG: hypothetical protein IJ109_06445 [Firmicutes bacterium]|nr:hypothetical protein [Bacillota bacterium]
MDALNHVRTARETVHDASGLIQLSFLRTTSELLQEMINADRSSVNALKQELSLTENASLYIKSRSGRCTFSCRDHRTKREIGITRDPDRVHRLARRAYLKQRIDSAEKQIQQLTKVLDRSEEAMQMQRSAARLQRYAKAGLDLSRILFTDEQNEWIDQPFSPNPHHPESLKYPTTHNILMRSKTEARLGSILEEIGLPYRSDDLVLIQYDPRGDQPYRDSYFADFKVPNLIGGITVHEHLGAFQIDRYADSSLKRLNDYHRFTICELPSRPVRHEEITWSFEHELHDDRMIRRLLRRMLLPTSIL